MLTLESHHLRLQGAILREPARTHSLSSVVAGIRAARLSSPCSAEGCQAPLRACLAPAISVLNDTNTSAKWGHRDSPFGTSTSHPRTSTPLECPWRHSVPSFPVYEHPALSLPDLWDLTLTELCILLPIVLLSPGYLYRIFMVCKNFKIT